MANIAAVSNEVSSCQAASSVGLSCGSGRDTSSKIASSSTQGLFNAGMEVVPAALVVAIGAWPSRSRYAHHALRYLADS
jgi:hypothetical protein